MLHSFYTVLLVIYNYVVIFYDQQPCTSCNLKDDIFEEYYVRINFVIFNLKVDLQIYL
jgi:hypothetical protein